MPETFHSPQQVKVFILYLLEKIGTALEYNDLATIVIHDGFVDYFDFVTYFHELLKDGHICRVPREEELMKVEQKNSGVPAENQDPSGKEDVPAEADEKPAELPVDRDSFMVTETGRMIARGLSDDLLLAAVREKSYISAMRHLSLEKRGAKWDHSLEQIGDGTYRFRCTISDRDGLALDLTLRADSYLQATRMAMNFEDKPDVVYRGIVALVTGNVNYLFDK